MRDNSVTHDEFGGRKASVDEAPSRLSSDFGPQEDVRLLDLHRGRSPAQLLKTESTIGGFEAPKTSATSYQSAVHVPPTTKPAWRPFWLRDYILALFFILFLCCTVALPCMLLYSDRLRGLGEVDREFVRSWRFGATAFLTLVAAFWTRVELQILRYTPWASPQSDSILNQPASSLDYTAMIMPVALMHSWKQRHFLVFIVIIVSIMTKLQVVLSPGLFYLDDVRSTRDTELRILTSFAASERSRAPVTGSNNSATAPWYNARALSAFNMSYPFGVTKHAAYQTFDHRGTIDSPITVAVDALFTDIQCIQSEGYETQWAEEPSEANTETTDYNVTLAVRFPDCDEPVSIKHNFTLPVDNVTIWSIEPQTKTPHLCPKLPKQYNQVVYLAALYERSAKTASAVELSALGAVICAPSAWVSKVEIADDGAKPNMTVLPNQDKNPIDVNLWNILPGVVPDFTGFWAPNESFSRDLAYGPAMAEASFRGADMYHLDRSIFRSDTLHRVMTSLTETVGPMISHHHLRVPDDARISGNQVVVMINQVKVTRAICIAMTCIFAISAVFALYLAISVRRRFQPWHRNPSTVLGALIFFNADQRSAGVEYSKADRKIAWSHSTFSPIQLTTWLRTLFLVYALALAIALAVTLSISQSSDGLVNMKEGTPALSWMLVPAIALFIVSLYASSSDTAVRDRAILSKLSSRPCTARELDMSLLDMLGVRALYHSLKSKIFAVTLTQVLAICCGFLTPLLSILFTVKIISEVEDVSIEQDSWFGVRRQGATSFNVWDTWRMQEDMGSLMLFQNSSELRYPEGTYRDLVYPIVKLNDAVQDWTGKVSVQLTLPAARLSPECFQLSDFKPNPDSEVADEDHIIASYTEEIICPNSLGQAALTRDIRVALGNETNPRYFAKTISSQDYAMLIRKLCKEDDDENTNYRPWTVETFMWGAISDSKKSFDHIEGWRCNYTWTEVPTQFTYHSSNSQPQLDYGRPPVSDDTKAKPWEPYFSTPNMDFLQPDFSIQNSQAAEVGEAFAPLIKPFGPLWLNEFGDSSKTDYILNTIHFRRAIVAAQYANVKNRLKLNDTSDTEPKNHLTILPSNGSVTRTNKRRLVQNFGVTIAIIAILALAFIINLWALGSRMMNLFVGVESDFLLDLNMKGVCPDEFNSLVSWHNLLHGAAGSTVLPRDSQYMSSPHTCKELAGVEFQIGWFYFNGLKEKYFTIGSLNDPNCEYLGRYER
ncbi:unnamed protein product [Clonostachys chloroleuca]|uniref:Uncharacterized protein n=1 Tax=Clonostachys chloroleuca TaxID=1926264 RepID=A0AA35LQC0_9HYPO|nr:unnamed protein product [Clonostachys chloroleuca]